MKFVFYDTETTGLNVDFDQILQFAAVLTDEKLRILDQFEVRCRVLPWIVASPLSLKVTNTPPGRLFDQSLPSHYEMLRVVRSKLDSWSPAIFVGYNSMKFDEEFLRRALRQTLQNPWLTVSNQNARLDLLSLVHGVSVLSPNALSWPTDPDGRRRFRLELLAPLNGYEDGRAHDALSDVLATVHLARVLRDNVPDLWGAAITRASRSEAMAVVDRDEPVFCVDPRDAAGALFCQRLSVDPRNPSAMIVARLDTDWETLCRRTIDDDLRTALTRSHYPIRSIALNKSPLIFTVGEAQRWEIRPSIAVLRQSRFLAGNPESVQRIMRIWSDGAARRSEPQHLEQTLYQGFPNREDENRSFAFHKLNWQERATMCRSFEDLRLRQWAQRLVYADAPECLEAPERLRLEKAIATRLLADCRDEALWRCIPSAAREVESMDPADAFAKLTREYLLKLKVQWQERLSRAQAV